MQSTVDLNWRQRFKGGLGPVANVCRGGEGRNYSYVTGKFGKFLLRGIIVCVDTRRIPAAGNYGFGSVDFVLQTIIAG